MATQPTDSQARRRTVTRTEAMEAAAVLLRWAMRDPATDEGVRETPRRIVDAWAEMTSGHNMDPAEVLATQFKMERPHQEIILLRGIRFTSLCEHHVLPFTGTAAVAYLPGEAGTVVGISKLARLVEGYARRLQVQERLGAQVVDALMKHLGAAGAAVVLEAHHECMGCRGVRQPDARMVTSAMRGVFMDEPAARNELLMLLR